MYCNATLMPLLLCFLLLSLLIDCLSLIQRISCIELILAHLQKKSIITFQWTVDITLGSLVCQNFCLYQNVAYIIAITLTITVILGAENAKNI